MNTTGSAFFLYRPRRMEDLYQPHPVERQHPYEIVKEITLGWMDFEYFSQDMLADRAFLARYADLCSRKGIFRCLLVKTARLSDGILVIPEEDFVQWAAVTPLD